MEEPLSQPASTSPRKKRVGRPPKVQRTDGQMRKFDNNATRSKGEKSGENPPYMKHGIDGRAVFGPDVNRHHVYLPPGWKCYATKRGSGIHKGIFDLVYVSPDGDRLRSRNEIYKWSRKTNIDLDPRKFLFARGLDVLSSAENAKSIIFRDATLSNRKRIPKSTSSTEELQDTFNTLISSRGREIIEEDDDETGSSSRIADEQSEDEFHLPDKDKTSDDLPVKHRTTNTPRKKSVELPKPRKIIDTLDCLKSPYFALKKEIPVKPVSILATDTGKWVPPRSPYRLIQEDLYHNPWQLLIATIFLNCTTGKLAIPIIHEFLTRWPTPHDACSASLHDILEVVDLLGLGRTRAATIIRFSHEFLTIDWRKPTELFGIGKYGYDSYKVFCLGQWRGVESDDKYLNLYVNWMHNVFSSRPTRPC